MRQALLLTISRGESASDPSKVAIIFALNLRCFCLLSLALLAILEEGGCSGKRADDASDERDDF